MAYQVIPRVKKGSNFDVVDKAIEVVNAADVPYQIGAMDENEQGNVEKAEELYTRIDPLSKKIVAYLDDLERAAKQ